MRPRVAPQGKKRPLRVRQPMKPDRKTTAERYDRREEEEEFMIQQPLDNSDADFVEIPTQKIQGKKSKAIFVIENAALEVAKVNKNYVLLNSSEHSEFLLRHGKKLENYRPDIVHQELLMVLDSPLKKSGNLQAVYVTTMSGVLIEVKPLTRIPRTYNRFAGLMRLSSSSEKRVKMKDYVAKFSDDTDLVFVVGATAHEKIEAKYIDDLVAVSDYPLSGAYCVTMICRALEAKWNIF